MVTRLYSLKSSGFHFRYHSLHHSQVRTNFSLFMPLYDYLGGTVDKNSDSFYQAVRKGLFPLIYAIHVWLAILPALPHSSHLSSCLLKQIEPFDLLLAGFEGLQALVT